MSIRLDPRRVSTLKHLAGEAGTRPGDLVRQWVEERLDAARGGVDVAESGGDGPTLLERVAALDARIAALESDAGGTKPQRAASPEPQSESPSAQAEAVSADESAGEATTKKPRGPRRATAAPSTERVALHDEMIEVIRERGAMPAADLAAAIVERGRYQVPRSGKPLDAKTVSQRVSNPTYRSRFVRDKGVIGLADDGSTEA